MLVSVIIPTFNRAPLITVSIRSVFGQTCQDFEVVIVDDGSTDNTAVVVKELAAELGDRIRYIYKTNGGCASARNVGLRHAQGKYVAFLDSDDWLLPRKLELQSTILETSGAEIAFGPWFDYYGPQEGPGTHYGPYYPVAYSQPEHFAREHFLNTNFSFTCALVRRDCFDLSKGPFDEGLKWNEDSDLAQRMALAGYRLVPVDYPCFVRRVHPGSKSQDRVRIYEHLLRSSQAVAEAHPAFREALGEAYDRRIAELHLLLARAHHRRGLQAALDYLAEAERQMPAQKSWLRRNSRDLRISPWLAPERLASLRRWLARWVPHPRWIRVGGAKLARRLLGRRYAAIRDRLLPSAPAQPNVTRPRPEQVPGAPPVR